MTGNVKFFITPLSANFLLRSTQYTPMISRFASVRDHYFLAGKIKGNSKFRPTRTSTRPLLKQLVMNAQKYFQTKLVFGCCYTSKTVQFLYQTDPSAGEETVVATIPCTTALLATPLPRLQNADRNRTSVCHSGSIRYHHYNHYAFTVLKKIPCIQQFSRSFSL